MKKHYFLPAVFFCFTLFSCKKNSTDHVTTHSSSNSSDSSDSSDYSITCSNKIAGRGTAFHSSNNKYKEEWDFGDGNKLSLALGSGAGSVGDIWHLYKAPGIYTVTLVVNGDESHKITQTDTIAPNYLFHYGGTPVVGDTIYFAFYAYLPKNGVTYSWSFGDGATSNDSAAYHIYRSQGNYVVKLTINNNPADPNLWKEITILRDPIYTHQLTKMRLWHGTIDVFDINGNAISTLRKVFPDSSFALNYVNKVNISYDHDNYIFNPTLSTGNYIVFSKQSSADEPHIIYYNYVTDSASWFTSEMHQPNYHQSPNTYEIRWQSPRLPVVFPITGKNNSSTLVSD